MLRKKGEKREKQFVSVWFSLINSLHILWIFFFFNCPLWNQVRNWTSCIWYSRICGNIFWAIFSSLIFNCNVSSFIRQSPMPIQVYDEELNAMGGLSLRPNFHYDKYGHVRRTNRASLEKSKQYLLLNVVFWRRILHTFVLNYSKLQVHSANGTLYLSFLSLFQFRLTRLRRDFNYLWIRSKEHFDVQNTYVGWTNRNTANESAI